ncbi:uncharacterized protein SPPG_01258 [Spizellomyces punctatus DAOM BR117]|uniref:AraC effector-binding domain-containing protein n=1 Tax=Spizellomyces punctatus (strain DAOM BR117) TaxID=645134 RepID=A0A0L0HQZ6_SPIPD|nr:uncharacterized protein SPPG_01258 [Spizellomyces punctatus DAOM BR117]KND03801.1 hypothetical protein SPPG_01258 [Spizellomyces punctatus DAOM BR117]|eukprot:XP_016611840.1 hypothetical protein SPPG_01258 [Spizellomyces punctatus DAOM BR117]
MASVSIINLPAHSALINVVKVQNWDFATAAKASIGGLLPFIEEHNLRPLLASSPASVGLCSRKFIDGRPSLYAMGFIAPNESDIPASVPRVSGDTSAEGLALLTFPAGEWATLKLKGSYAGIAGAFDTVVEFVKEDGREVDSERVFCERYLNDCRKVDTEDLETDILVPIK